MCVWVLYVLVGSVPKWATNLMQFRQVIDLLLQSLGTISFAFKCSGQVVELFLACLKKGIECHLICYFIF